MSVVSPNPQTTYPSTLVLTRTVSVQLQPSITASSAYVANNCVGGRLIFNNILGGQQSGVVQSITVACKTTQTTGYKLYLFTANPSNTTVSDKTAVTLNPLDLPNLVDVITLGAADSSLTATLNVADNIGRAVVSPTTNLYGILITTGTPTYVAISDLYVTVTVLQD